MVREEVLQKVWEAQDEAYALMSEYDSLPHHYGNDTLYQAEGEIVNLIAAHPGITVTDLGDLLKRTVSACSQIVRKLRDKGLVEQTRNPENNRLYNLALTESGRKVYEARHAFNLECQAINLRLLEGFSEEELEAHLRVQQVLNQAYEGDIRRSREAMKKE